MTATRRSDGPGAPRGNGIVLYDFLYCRGGAEQVTLDLVRGLENAELCVGFRDPDMFSDEVMAGIRCIEIALPARVPGLRTYSGLRAFSRRADFVHNYDWAIFGGSNAPAAVHHRRKRGNVYYCHTLPRFAYDLKEFYLYDGPPWRRPLIRALVSYTRPRYEAALRRMDRIVANSRNVQNRLRRYLDLDAAVVYPPCDVSRFQWLEEGSYYLSTARLETYKRVERIINAFRRLPDKKLVVTSGGSQAVKLKALAEGMDNVFFTGWIDQQQMQELVGRAIATIYVPRDEDFGLSPVESLAAGKPVIGVAEGGLLETIADGQTGILLEGELDAEKLSDAVNRLTVDRSHGMRRACEDAAYSFRKEVFLEKMRDQLRRL